MTPEPPPAYSIIVPCYNEEDAAEQTLEELARLDPEGLPYEIIMVNDGSYDRTGEILTAAASKYPSVQIAEHQTNRGYGAALKTGIRRAQSNLIVITDADGTYPNHRIPEFVAKCEQQDMVVGARVGGNVSYSRLRAFPKFFLRMWMSWIAGQRIPDINSGLRVFRKDVAESFFGILPDSFSFTVTITLAMLTNYRRVLFLPISYNERIGRSKIKPVQDSLRFVLLILRTGTYFAPLRLFFPLVITLLIGALASLLYDVVILNDLTDTTLLLFLFALNSGMFALIADMIDKRS